MIWVFYKAFDENDLTSISHAKQSIGSVGRHEKSFKNIHWNRQVFMNERLSIKIHGKARSCVTLGEGFSADSKSVNCEKQKSKPDVDILLAFYEMLRSSHIQFYNSRIRTKWQPRSRSEMGVKDEKSSSLHEILKSPECLLPSRHNLGALLRYRSLIETIILITQS